MGGEPAKPETNRRTLLRATIAVAAAASVAASIAALRGQGGASAETRAATPSAPQAATPGGCALSVRASPIATPTPVVIVEMTTQLRFEPEHLLIKIGDRVRWENVGEMPHTATDDLEQNPVAKSHPEYALLPDGAEPWASPLLQPGEHFEHTFTVAGSYRYFCIPHVLSGMRGSIAVECETGN